MGRQQRHLNSLKRKKEEVEEMRRENIVERYSFDGSIYKDQHGEYVSLSDLKQWSLVKPMTLLNWLQNVEIEKEVLKEGSATTVR